MLLLDEPTNHLDALSVPWLEKYLEDFKSTVLCITHDRCFMEQLTTWRFELDNGCAYPHEGNYSTYLKAKRLAAEEPVESALLQI